MNPSPNSRRNALPRALKWGLVAVVALPLLGILIARLLVTSDIKRLEARAVARGEPLTLAELAERIPSIPDDENAAIAILDIWESEDGSYWQGWRENGGVSNSRRPRTNDPALPFRGSGQTAIPWLEKETAAARSFAESRKERNKEMREALARNRARYPVRYLDGFNALLPHLSSIKTEVSGYQIENYLAIQEDRIDDSIDTLRQMVRMTNTLREEKFLISQLVRIACEAITMNGIKELISRQPLTGDQLRQLESLLQDLESKDEFYRAMLAERVGALSVFRMSAAEIDAIGATAPAGNDSLMSAAVVGVMRFTGIAGIDKRLMMKTFDEVLVLSTNLTVANQKLISDAMDRAVDEAGSFPPKIFTRLLLPALGNASAKFLKVESERRLLLIAIHVEQYRLLHEGRLPDSLDELNSKLFVRDVGDVFEGVLIQFTPTESGYHINTSLSESGDSASSGSGTVDTFSVTIVHYYESDEE